MSDIKTLITPAPHQWINIQGVNVSFKGFPIACTIIEGTTIGNIGMPDFDYHLGYYYLGNSVFCTFQSDTAVTVSQLSGTIAMPYPPTGDIFRGSGCGAIQHVADGTKGGFISFDFQPNNQIYIPGAFKMNETVFPSSTNYVFGTFQFMQVVVP